MAPKDTLFRLCIAIYGRSLEDNPGRGPFFGPARSLGEWGRGVSPNAWGLSGCGPQGCDPDLELHAVWTLRGYPATGGSATVWRICTLNLGVPGGGCLRANATLPDPRAGHLEVQMPPALVGPTACRGTVQNRLKLSHVDVGSLLF